MFEKLSLTRTAQSLAAHSGAQLGVIAKNIANADTPGYKAQSLSSFSEVYRAPTSFVMRSTHAKHLSHGDRPPEYQAHPSGGRSSPSGNDVSLDIQMMKSVEARQNHEMALAVYKTVSNIIRTSLGRH